MLCSLLWYIFCEFVHSPTIFRFKILPFLLLLVLHWTVFYLYHVLGRIIGFGVEQFVFFLFCFSKKRWCFSYWRILCAKAGICCNIYPLTEGAPCSVFLSLRNIVLFLLFRRVDCLPVSLRILFLIFYFCSGRYLSTVWLVTVPFEWVLEIIQPLLWSPRPNFLFVVSGQ